MSERRARVVPARSAVRLTVAAVTVAMVGVVSGCATPAPVDRSASAAPSAPPAPSAPSAEQQPAPYIVVLDDGAASSAAVADVAEQHAGMGLGAPADHEQVYSHALRGYTAELSAAEAALLQLDDRVAFVEPDRVVSLVPANRADPTTQLGPQPQQVPTGVRRIFADQNPIVDIDGIDDARVDVDVAVIDSGVSDHPDLDVVARTDCTQGPACVDGAGDDDNGHGTHVAGTIAAVDDGDDVVGVAPGARIHSVKACSSGGQCMLSSMVAGVDWVAAHADVIEVANMSLAGRGESMALDQALTAAVGAGVVPVVAAGNSHQDASGWFPSNYPDAITVSALADADGLAGGLAPAPGCRPQSEDEALADFSNFGPAVDLIAPGVCILSTWNDGGLASMSGTSMATPHVSGAAAVLAQGPGGPDARDDVLAIRQWLVNTGNLDWFDNSGDGVQEPLLDMIGLAS